MNETFGQVIVCDFEYETAALPQREGDLPNVLCMVAYVLNENLQHVHTIRLWRGDFGKVPPFDTGPDTLFTAYSSWAEMTCFMVLGWKFPVHIFDQHTAYLATSTRGHALVHGIPARSDRFVSRLANTRTSGRRCFEWRSSINQCVF